MAGVVVLLSADNAIASAFGGSALTWPGGNVYYSFSNNVSVAKQNAFLDAAAEWAMFANLHFIQRTTQSNYVLIYESPGLEGGAADGGMSPNGQSNISIGPNAWNRNTLCHEIGHCLGLMHEQNRSDRDSYVMILSNNIAAGLDPAVVFPKESDSRNQGPYDFLSVMQYAKNGLSADPAHLDTIVPLPPYIQYIDIMGVKLDPVLSAGDRAGMAAVYGFGPPNTHIVTTTADNGPGSLRAAFYYAFDHPGTTISFNIPTNDPGFSNGVFTIKLTDVLPSLPDRTILDATTQPQLNPPNPAIVLTCISPPVPPTYPFGLRLHGTNCVVRGLLITGFPAMGVLIEQGASSNLIGGPLTNQRNIISGNGQQGVVIFDTNTVGNIIQGNYIGVNASGIMAMSNGWEAVGIYTGSHGNRVLNNVLSGNGSVGVRIGGAHQNIVQGNMIGVNASGAAAVPNGWHGVALFNGAQSNLVGGTSPPLRNVISGNSQQGLIIADTNTVGNVIVGNYIGLDGSGNSAISNAWAGVSIFNGACSNFVGGTTAGSRNVISGNGQQGITIADPGTIGNYIEGNFIGVNAAGTAAVPNQWVGVNCFNASQKNFIGGAVPGAGNVISGNAGAGVVFQNFGTGGHIVQGNFIGVNPDGTSPISNGGPGILIADGSQSNLIGGSWAAARNVISGNNWSGVSLNDSGTVGNVISGNFIGLNSSGTASIPNSFYGIEVNTGASQNRIGGVSPGCANAISGNAGGVLIRNAGSSGNTVQGNLIGLNAFGTSIVPNTGPGVLMYDGARSNSVGGPGGGANLIAGNNSDGISLSDIITTNNSVRGNSIFSNNGAGIALYSSANRSAAAPSITSAVVTTNTTVSGSLTSFASTTFQIDFYSSPTWPAQGATYLGWTNVTTSGSGSVSFTVKLASHVPAGRMITATATDPFGNTSEMSSGAIVSATSSVNDGIPNAWRALYFGGNGTTTNSQSCATCDPDDDGMNNLEEFLAGTNPTNSGDALRLNPSAADASSNIASFLSTSGTVYRVQYRDDLASGFWMIGADQIIGTGTNVFIADPGVTENEKRFYRLQVLW